MEAASDASACSALRDSMSTRLLLSSSGIVAGCSAAVGVGSAAEAGGVVDSPPSGRFSTLAFGKNGELGDVAVSDSEVGSGTADDSVSGVALDDELLGSVVVADESWSDVAVG